MSAVEPDNSVKMDLDDSGCVQDESSPSKSGQPEDDHMQSVNLLDLPDELLFSILKYCTPHSLKALGFTCARLGALVLERSFWNYVDARDICTNRSRMRWMVQNFHVGTRSVFLHGHANEARGCRGHVNRTRSEAEEDKPNVSSGLLCNLGGGDAPSNNAENEESFPPPPEALVHVLDGHGDLDAEPIRFPLQRMPPRLHMNRLNDFNTNQLPRQRGSPTWPEDCELDEEEDTPQQSLDDTAGCGGPVFTLSADIMRELCIRCPRLYQLNLEYCNINCSRINLSSFPTALRRLSLKGTRCYNPPLDKSYLFRIHDYLPVLEHLDLSECAWLEPAALLPLSKMAHLRVLLMRACPAMAEFVAYVSLATRYGFRKLKVLDMRESPVGDSEVSALGWLPELEELYLSAPPPSPRPAAPHHHYIGDPLPRRPPLDPWEMQIPPYYMSRCEESCDSPDVGDDVEAQLNALQAKPPLSIEVRTRLRLPMSRNPNLPQNPTNPQSQNKPDDTQRRKRSSDAEGPQQKRTKRDSKDKDSDDDSDTEDDDDDDRDNGAEMDTSEDKNSRDKAEDDSSSDKNRKSSTEDESKSIYRIFKHKNVSDDGAGSSNDNSVEEPNCSSSSKCQSGCRRYVYKLNYGPLSSTDDVTQSEEPKKDTKQEQVNEGASTSKKPESDEKTDRVKEEQKPKTEDGKEDSQEIKTELSDAKTNEDESSRDTKEDSNENKPEGGMEENLEPGAGPSNDRRTTYSCRIDVQDGDSTSRYSIRVQVKNEMIDGERAREEEGPGEEERGEYHNGIDPSLVNMVEEDMAQVAMDQPAEAEPAPLSPPVRHVRFVRDHPPVVLRVPRDEEQNAEPRHHVLYVNLGQQLHAVYRLLPHRAPAPAALRTPPADHLEAHSLVSDASIRRFGRADGENVNIVNIGPDGPRFGARDNSGRPNRSSLRILSATGYRNITNRSLVHLATAAPNLQSVDFSNTGVTAEGVEQFKILRPEVEVTHSQFKIDDVEE